MTSPPWPEWLDAVWAKSVSGRPEQEGESLARHTWSVLTTFSQMVRLHPWLPEYLGKPGLWNSLFWACWLHDLGKSCGQFQTMLRGGPKWGHRHEVLSLLFLDWVAPCLSDEESIWVAASVASHHKDAGSIFHLYPLPVEGVPDSLDGLVKDIPLSSLQGIRRWILECSEPWIRHLGLSEHGIEVPHMGGEDQIESLRQDGASRIHCWLRAYRRWWDRLDRGDDNRPRTASLALRGHINTSDHVASAHVATQVRGIGADAGQLLLDWRMDPEKLYEHQKQSLDTRGNALLVAPTGSGKTEAALLWAVGQARQGSDVPRLFYMLPYQASMNAMYNRLNSGHLLDQVGLEHSRSVLALYRYHLEEDASPAQAERDSRAAKNLARLHQYPVRVLSPYQLLKGPYRIRGYEALLNDCFGATFILDEVHAYEANRLAMILATVKHLREQFDASFFVMTATLPGLLKKQLLAALGDVQMIRASGDLFSRFSRHTLRLLPGDLLFDHNLEGIAGIAAEGRSVLVCCNTVARAQQAFQELEKRLRGNVEMVLLHGRFNGKDRLEKEQTIQEATGRRSAAPRAIVLVATQVVEVSLDIDLDTIYTDPAPLDALIQRFGRVNRAGRKGLVPVHVFSSPEDGQGIYDATLVGNTLRLLNDHDGASINEEATSEWLDDIYSGEYAARWAQEYGQTQETFEASCIQPLRAFHSDEKLEDEFYRAFDSVEVVPDCRRTVYQGLMDEGRPLEAVQEMVPLRWAQVERLRRKKRATRASTREPWVVDADYTSDTGLALTY